jgi:hypothetical protein
MAVRRGRKRLTPGATEGEEDGAAAGPPWTLLLPPPARSRRAEPVGHRCRFAARRCLDPHAPAHPPVEAVEAPRLAGGGERGAESHHRRGHRRLCSGCPPRSPPRHVDGVGGRRGQLRPAPVPVSMPPIAAGVVSRTPTDRERRHVKLEKAPTRSYPGATGWGGRGGGMRPKILCCLDAQRGEEGRGRHRCCSLASTAGLRRMDGEGGSA